MRTVDATSSSATTVGACLLRTSAMETTTAWTCPTRCCAYSFHETMNKGSWWTAVHLRLQVHCGGVTSCNETSQFRCRKTNVCIPSEQRCNAQYDCGAGDYTDEEDCVERCIGRFTCDNGRCVTNASKCDGVDDCGDASDERGCSDVTCYRAGDTSDVYACRTGDDVTDVQCIPRMWLCDGEKDCALGDDEDEDLANCSKTPPNPSAIEKMCMIVTLYSAHCGVSSTVATLPQRLDALY